MCIFLLAPEKQKQKLSNDFYPFLHPIPTASPYVLVYEPRSLPPTGPMSADLPSAGDACHLELEIAN